MARSSVTDTDHGYEALRKRVFGIKNPKIAVGILAGPGAAPHANPGGRDPLTVLDVATINEFGAQWTDKAGRVHEIPERSFIRDWFDAAEPELREKMLALMQDVIAGRREVDQILQLLGLYCVGQIEQRIADGVPPPNAPSTIKKKGSSKPLINSGQLRASVTFEVREGDSDEGE
jgi:hypothetical protein